MLIQLLQRDLGLHGFRASSFSGFLRFFGRAARQLESQLRPPGFFFGGSGFLFRRLDLFYGNTDCLFCVLRRGFDVGWFHESRAVFQKVFASLPAAIHRQQEWRPGSVFDVSARSKTSCSPREGTRPTRFHRKSACVVGPVPSPGGFFNGLLVLRQRIQGCCGVTMR